VNQDDFLQAIATSQIVTGDFVIDQGTQNLMDRDYIEVVFKNCSIHGGQFVSSVFQGCTFDDVLFEESALVGVSFVDCTFTLCRMVRMQTSFSMKNSTIKQLNLVH